MSVKISALPAAVSVGVDDFFPIVQSGTTKRATPTLPWTFGAGVSAPSFGTGAASNLLITSSGGTQVTIFHTALVTNFIQLGGAPASGTPHMGAAGADANTPLNIFSKGSGNISFLTNANATVQFRVSHTASAVNFGQITGGGTGAPIVWSAVGTDSTINVVHRASGATALHRFDGGGVTFFDMLGTTSGINYFAVIAGAAGASPVLLAGTGGSPDTNITFRYRAKGTGGHFFETNNTQDTGQFEIRHTASSTRWITATGSNGGNPVLSTTAGALAVTTLLTCSSSINAADATAIPAGGTAGVGFRFSSTSNFGVFFGSGVPSLAAAKGSLYLRSDGSTTNDRAYINTNGSTTWTALTTAG